MRILFVDDEPAILDGLRNLLRRHRRRWEMVFAVGGEAALSELATASFDVVISDMRMPGMDGAAFLGRVKADHPRAARLVLSGQADRQAVLRVLPVAHQFLGKPCDAETLPAVIERTCRLRSLVSDEALTTLVGGIDKLPSPPRIYWQLNEAMADPDVSLPTISDILEQDPASSGKLLHLANSAYSGLTKPVTRVQQAVSYLGLELIRGTILSAHLMDAASKAPEVVGFSYDELQRTSAMTARLARRLMGNDPRAAACFTAGLLHDLGMLIVATAFPDKLGTLLAAKGALGGDQERALFGFTHAEAGSYLLGLWGVAETIVDAVAHHHAPAQAADTGFGVAACVHVARALIEDRLPATGANRGTGPALDRAYLERIGVADRIEAWCDLAAEEMTASVGA